MRAKLNEAAQRFAFELAGPLAKSSLGKLYFTGRVLLAESPVETEILRVREELEKGFVVKESELDRAAEMLTRLAPEITSFARFPVVERLVPAPMGLSRVWREINRRDDVVAFTYQGRALEK